MDNLGTTPDTPDWIEPAEEAMSKKTPEKEADTSSSEEEEEVEEEEANNIPCIGYHTEIVKRSDKPGQVDMLIHPPKELLDKYPSLKKQLGGKKVIRSNKDVKRYLDKLKELKLELPENCRSTDFLIKTRKSDLSEEELKMLRAVKWTKGEKLAELEEAPDSPIDEDDEQSDDETSESDSSEGEDPSHYFKKIERNINNSILEEAHPEIININSDEMMALSKCVKNKAGIVVDLLHQTLPFLTKYERAKILGLRAKQLNSGSKPFINITEQMLDGYTIACEELYQKKIPFIIRRPLPNGASEYWKIEDLDLIDN